MPVRGVAFYRDMLGLKQTDVDMPYWVEFDVGGSCFGVGNFEQVGAPGGAQSLALEVDDLEALRAELIAHQLDVTEAFETPVCFISVVKDPDGNQIWLHQAKPK